MVGCAEIRILENHIYMCLSFQQKYKATQPIFFFIHMSAFRKACRSLVTLWGFGQPHKACWWWGYTGSLGQEPAGVLVCPETSKAFCKLLRGVDEWYKSILPMHTDPAKSFPCTQTQLNPCSDPFTSLAFEDLSTLAGSCKWMTCFIFFSRWLILFVDWFMVCVWHAELPYLWGLTLLRKTFFFP